MRAEGMTMNSKRALALVDEIFGPWIENLHPVHEAGIRDAVVEIRDSFSEAISEGELDLGRATREQLVSYGRENELLIPLVTRALDAMAALDAALAAIEAARIDADAAKKHAIEMAKQTRARVDEGLRFDVQHPERV